MTTTRAQPHPSCTDSAAHSPHSTVPGLGPMSDSWCGGRAEPYAPAGDPACVAPLGSFAPAVGSRWVDCHHDVWTMRADGLMETPETRPFPPSHVEKKWGPLLPAREVTP